jgi:hypothetical protein
MSAQLDDYLRAAGALPIGTRPPDPPSELSKLPIDARIALAVHLIEGRMAGRFHGPAYFAADAAMSLLLRTLETPPRASLERLLHAIGATGSHLCGYPWEYAWKAAQREIDARGLSPSLYDALRAMQGSMKVHTSDKNAALQIDRALWFETWTTLDPTVDAGDIVRRDLRNMPPGDAAAWRTLLLHGMNGPGAEAPKPPWLRKAQKLLSPLADVLVSRTEAWLRGVGEIGLIQVTKAGADGLRAVIWACAATEKLPINAILSIALRPWKRGSAWSSRQERLVGSLAWAIEQGRHHGGRAALEALRDAFGRTTAGAAIQRAQAALG